MDEEEFCYCHYHNDTYEYFDCLDYMDCEECPYYYADEDQVVKQMERLTERGSYGYGDVYVRRNDYVTASKKLCEYEDAEEQGLLLRLPCKVGDVIYEIHSLTGKITPRKIKSIVVCNCPDLTIMYKSGYDYSNVQEDLGKTVFLTQAEAEQKLKEMEYK